ncbi:MAG: MFS transporter [Alphaproteobacteria bacterium]|nr:MFS transporter [Alphaproteobacteria bacterium]MDE2113136.1 MFS transporter [Alphaproteobacteria bacterium]MDE2494609.1 MFS transporter [Alphaproteobacteria bacterium]
MRAPGVTTADIPAARRSIPAHHVLAVVLGNGLEFYDFLCYAIFAVYIGKAYFPPGDASISLLLSLATFGIGFVTRPIGGIVLGSLGDRIGRKPAMLISFALMGAGMLGVALTPGYAAIGIAAPILLVFFRLIQGFALGGEVGPTTAYLIEAAPPERRGFYGSMQYASQDTAVLIASGVGVLMAGTLSHAMLENWGWRFAFLAGVVIVPFGILIRRSLPETLHAADDAALAPDATLGKLTLAARIRPYLRVLICGLLLLAATTIANYVLDYMATYSLVDLHLPAGIAFGVTMVTSLVEVIFEPISGLLSDRFGRKPVMMFPTLLMLLSILPAFWLISHYPSQLVLYSLMGFLALLLALGSPPIIIALTESLPARIRSGAVATVYAFAISVFGGSTQFVITWLIRITGDPLAPAWYWTAACLVGVAVMFLLPESAPRKTGR